MSASVVLGQACREAPTDCLSMLCLAHIFTLYSYLTLHGLESKHQVADDMKQFIEKYRSSGKCTAPCADPVQKDEALIMADSGEAAAILWCKFSRWLP